MTPPNAETIAMLDDALERLRMTRARWVMSSLTKVSGVPEPHVAQLDRAIALTESRRVGRIATAILEHDEAALAKVAAPEREAIGLELAKLQIQRALPPVVPDLGALRKLATRPSRPAAGAPLARISAAGDLRKAAGKPPGAAPSRIEGLVRDYARRVESGELTLTQAASRVVAAAQSKETTR